MPLIRRHILILLGASNINVVNECCSRLLENLKWVFESVPCLDGVSESRSDATGCRFVHRLSSSLWHMKEICPRWV
jgi:hypothetical protein